MNCPFCKTHVQSIPLDIDRCKNCPNNFAVGTYYESFKIGKYVVIVDLETAITSIFLNNNFVMRTSAKTCYDWSEDKIDKLLVLI